MAVSGSRITTRVPVSVSHLKQDERGGRVSAVVRVDGVRAHNEDREGDGNRADGRRMMRGKIQVRRRGVSLPARSTSACIMVRATSNTEPAFTMQSEPESPILTS